MAHIQTLNDGDIVQPHNPTNTGWFRTGQRFYESNMHGGELVITLSSGIAPNGLFGSRDTGNGYPYALKMNMKIIQILMILVKKIK